MDISGHRQAPTALTPGTETAVPTAFEAEWSPTAGLDVSANKHLERPAPTLVSLATALTRRSGKIINCYVLRFMLQIYCTCNNVL